MKREAFLAKRVDKPCYGAGGLRSSRPMAEADSSSYCARELKEHDRDRYLTCLFAPGPERAALFALYAFNLEVAKTAEVVSEPMLGRIRLQWWREAIEGIYDGRPRDHQVIQPLAEAVARHDLPRGDFERLIDAREFDLEREPPADLAGLVGYAEATSGTLAQLALGVLGATGGSCRQAGGHVGLAWALVGLLRAVPFHARHKRLYLPANLVQSAGLDLGDLFELRPSPQLATVAERVAARAAEALGEARRLRPEVPARALPAMLPAILVERYLRVLARAGHDPFHPLVRAEAPGQVWRLAWAKLRRRY